jgi:hypothetical protein
MEEKKEEKKGWLSALWESLFKGGGCGCGGACGSGEEGKKEDEPKP